MEMKRRIACIAACVLLVACAAAAYECHRDLLAGCLFVVAVVPSVLYAEVKHPDDELG